MDVHLSSPTAPTRIEFQLVYKFYMNIMAMCDGSKQIFEKKERKNFAQTASFSRSL